MSKYSNLRKKTFLFLEGKIHDSFLARQVNPILICLIIANVIAVILESDDNIGREYSIEFALFEILSVSIFTIEYLLRVWSSVEFHHYKHYSSLRARLCYIISPVAIIDLLAIAPFFISLFFVIDLRYLRLFRVLRLLKLMHYFKSFNIFMTVIAKEFKSIVAAIMVMSVLIVIAASLMYSLENAAQPDVFGNILESLWWAVVTMTTVGYGDVTPVTMAGKIVATFIMLIGVGLVALPAGMLAARFGDELRERRRKLDAYVKHALTDGVIDTEEYDELAELAGRLELNLEDLERNIELSNKTLLPINCPHCGGQLNKG